MSPMRMMLAVAPALAILTDFGFAAGGKVQNADFEANHTGEAPAAWFVPGPCVAEGWRADTVKDGLEGTQAVRLHREADGAGGFGNLMQMIPAEELRGLRVRLAAHVNFTPQGRERLQMWLRVDRPGSERGFFDNMQDRPVTESGWREVTIVGDVEEDAEAIAVGFMILGGGSEALIDDVRLEVIGDAGAGDAPAAVLEGQGLENVAAFARLVGAVRHFHPSDEAVRTQWLNFSVRGIDEVQRCGSAEELAARLQRLFSPIAPTVQVWVGSAADAPPDPEADEDARPEWIVGIRHFGLGRNLQGTSDNSIYHSKRVREKPGDAAGVLPDFPCETVMELGAGLSARIPHLLRADAEGTPPRAADAKVEAMNPDRPKEWSPSPSDRSVRLATVIEAWNVLQHFYPYWDVIDADWPAQLRRSLSQAAEVEGRDGLRQVLAELVAAARDGHGNLVSGGGGAMVPVVAEWVEGKLVVIHAPEQTGFQPGDIIASIDRTSVADIYERVSNSISASTEGWRRYRSVREILAWGVSGEVDVGIERWDGNQLSLRVSRIAPEEWRELKVKKPAMGEEIAPDIFYVDLDGLSWEDLEPHLDQLVNAKGIVFDLRGYPGSAGAAVLNRLTDEAIHSPFWHIPQYMKPDQTDVEYAVRRWTVWPMQPRLPSNVAFITDGRAISYAETCLAIVEAYGLGEIVGATTAGTNGNVNQRELAGGFLMIWTGMRVVKHDGETVHQGVGVKPTVPCERTIAGAAACRDELLEKAVEALEGG